MTDVITEHFVYQWRTDVHRNPQQLPDNRRQGREHPPALLRGNIWWQGPEIFIVYAHGGIRDVSVSFESAVAFIDAEYHEWRYVSTIGSTWTAEIYMGGSGPVGLLVIHRRRLSDRRRR